MKNGYKLVLVTLPIILAGVGFLAFTVANKQPPQQIELRERITAVRVIAAQKQMISPVVSGFGLVNPARKFEAITQVSGVAEYVNPGLRKGAILPKDAVLLRLSPSDFTLAVAQARANIRAAEARLAEIAISRENLSSALEIEHEVLALKADELQRYERLFAAGTASQSARDGSRAGHLAQRQKVQSLQNSLALLPTQHLVQIEQIAVYQASLETAQLNLGRTELRLPFAARVGSVSIEVGQLVSAGKTVATFDGVQTAEVEAQIPAADLQRLFQIKGIDSGPFAIDPSVISRFLHSMALQANVRLRLGKDMVEWPAKLDRISNEIDPKTGTVGVIVRVEGAYSSVKPGVRPPLSKGMFVEVTLAAPKVAGLLVPRSALRNGQIMVVNADNRLQLLAVVPFLVQGDIALITEGLPEGAKVLVKAPVPAIEGMLLEAHVDADLMAQLAAAGQAQ